MLDGSNVRGRGRSGNAWKLREVNGDGMEDLIFQVIDGGLYQTGDAVASQVAETSDGIFIEETDSIYIVP